MTLTKLVFAIANQRQTSCFDESNFVYVEERWRATFLLIFTNNPMKYERKIHGGKYIGFFKTSSYRWISCIDELAHIELVVSKFQDRWMRSEIFEKFHDS